MSATMDSEDWGVHQPRNSVTNKKREVIERLYALFPCSVTGEWTTCPLGGGYGHFFYASSNEDARELAVKLESPRASFLGDVYSFTKKGVLKEILKIKSSYFLCRLDFGGM